ncbi:MAG TPA: phosphoglycerate mutase family protein [Candidatus Paceibacterota bacterium]
MLKATTKKPRKTTLGTAKKPRIQKSLTAAPAAQEAVVESPIPLPLKNEGPKLPELVVVIRHGEYDESSRGCPLSKHGQEQMCIIAHKLEEFVKGKTVALFSSRLTRAVESAKIIGDHLHVTHEEKEVLEPKGEYLEELQIDNALKLIEEARVDVVILTTHLEFVEQFPSHYAQRALKADLHSREIPKGSAWLIKCKVPELVRING